jgi:hypothetical protein
MRPSRGMGDMKASKMPKAKTIRRKDNPDDVTVYAKGGKVGLYDNINAKRKRIAAGSGEKMRKPGSEGAPTEEAFANSKKTAKMAKGGNFIQKAIKKPGALHEQMGIPKGKKIPAKALAKAAKAPGKLGQRARFAQVLKGFKKGK